MVDAANHTTPATRSEKPETTRSVSPHIDHTCRRLCLQDARERVARGENPQRAALLATPGCFADFRNDVLAALLD